MLLHCGAEGWLSDSAQPVDEVRVPEPRPADDLLQLLRDELDADEFAMASLVDAVHWLRAGRSTGAAWPGCATLD
jgi:hypothetical protein